jgi:hypothetical protein
MFALTPRLPLLLALVAVVILAGASTASPASARPQGGPIRIGCRVVFNKAVGDPRRIFAVPNGCVWLYRPSTRRAVPVVIVRLSRRTAGFALPNWPLGAANGICNVTSFLVDWPLVTVVADSLWYQVNGKPQCRRSSAAAAIWMFYWHPGPTGGGVGRGGHFSRWFTSPSRNR